MFDSNYYLLHLFYGLGIFGVQNILEMLNHHLMWSGFHHYFDCAEIRHMRSSGFTKYFYPCGAPVRPIIIPSGHFSGFSHTHIRKTQFFFNRDPLKIPPIIIVQIVL